VRLQGEPSSQQQQQPTLWTLRTVSVAAIESFESLESQLFVKSLFLLLELLLHSLASVDGPL
jgi:hypothetical protein